MNAPINALAVLDFHAKGQQSSMCSYPRLRSFDELAQVRVAVAELIEAEKEYERVRWAPYNRHDPISTRQARAEFLAAQHRRSTALARMQGSQS